MVFDPSIRGGPTGAGGFPRPSGRSSTAVERALLAPWPRCFASHHGGFGCSEVGSTRAEPRHWWRHPRAGPRVEAATPNWPSGRSAAGFGDALCLSAFGLGRSGVVIGIAGPRLPREMGRQRRSARAIDVLLRFTGSGPRCAHVGLDRLLESQVTRLPGGGIPCLPAQHGSSGSADRVYERGDVRWGGVRVKTSESSSSS